jgi:uncharacterized membrane protein YhaH (DUF805 family)
MNYIVDCLKKYATFSGRARRKEYWLFVLFTFVVSILLMVVSRVLGSIFQLAIIIPAIAVAVRRMHDVGKSGWFMLIPIYSLILACTNGTAGPNEFGPDPKSEENLSVATA